jgi:hypothetical protein
LQARAPQILTPKNSFFDMPSFLKYGSTGRPPGKFHIRHSPKKITENLEFSHPPFDILFIEITNNNNNNINYIDNGGSGTDGNSDTNDIAVPAAVGNNTNVVGHRSNQIAAASEWFANRFESNRSNCKHKFNTDCISTTTTTTPTINYNVTTTTIIDYNISSEDGKDAEAPGLPEGLADRLESNHINKYKFNIDGISTTTPATTTTNHKTSAEGISNEDGEAGLSVWSTDRFASNQFNSGTDQIESTQFWYKFNIKAISTTSTTIAPATPATVTINYKTSAEGISNEGGEEAEAAAGLSEWFESNQCNSISNNNNSNTGSISTSNKDKYNETSHHFFLFKLISLYLIITKSFSSNTKEPKEKHHHQQQQEHYHAKDRHQFHLEQQQKHQHFKQEQHNMERMVTSIVLKLSLVAWDMWAFRNVF